jgi:hypothetical protein
MSTLFMCGQNGCCAAEIDDAARIQANEQRIRWANINKNKTGKFPTMQEQEDFITTTYNRITTIKIAVFCPHCGKKIEAKQ